MFSHKSFSHKSFSRTSFLFRLIDAARRYIVTLASRITRKAALLSRIW